jgi:hypothetical protein
MLSLSLGARPSKNIATIIAGSGRSSNTNGPGYFEVTYDLDYAMWMLRIYTDKVWHDGDTNTNDLSPGIKLSNLDFKVNGTTNSNIIPLSDDYTNSNPAVGLTAVDNNGSLTYGDNMYNSYMAGNQIVYTQSSLGGTISSGSTVTISGNITLNDGTSDVYEGESGYEGAYLLLRTNGHSINESDGQSVDFLRIFMTPGYQPTSSEINGQHYVVCSS